ncbi:MAG: hypothetical protein M1818_002211 [Claussenomyces sp. TS43310]|nr:MAG: hypothetical protein M1818_002211 [Claussenomyces sp. TS43310]
MAAAAPQQRAGMAHGQVRTSSIDSAISSLSAGTKAQDSPSRDAGSPDITNLIQAAGSSEAVIQHLLKEKQSQSAQNTQLWRLVDKQRAMILGLNKDLERALKDKERYRKKLKETLAQTSLDFHSTSSATPSHEPSHTSRSPVQQANQVKTPALATMQESEVDQPDLPASPIDVGLGLYPTAPSGNPASHPAKPVSNGGEAGRKMMPRAEGAFANFGVHADTPTEPVMVEQQRKTEATRELPHDASAPPFRCLPADPPPRIAAASSSSDVVQARKQPSTDDRSKTFPPPPRKAPPAPLNLGKTLIPSAQLHEVDSTEDSNSDSDYDDVLEVDEIPSPAERGRRKTREEDDRLREVAAVKDAELRSLSKKSKSRPTSPSDKVPAIQVEAMPAGPRQAVGISPPDARVQRFPPPDTAAGSLAGMLSAVSGADKGSSTVTTLAVAPSLMSPGLPVSPRPADRGMSLPLPRNPREGGSGISSLASPPLSPRGIGGFPSAMPLSPRAPRQPIPLPPNTPMSLGSPGLTRGPTLELSSPKALQSSKKNRKAENGNVQDADPGDSAKAERSHSIFQGFLTDEYPDLLLPPNALPSIQVRVASSRLRPSRISMMSPMKADEDPVFTLAVFGRSDEHELWRVQRDSNSLAQLDQELRRSSFAHATVPDKSLFSGHSPARIDARRAALESYFDEILNTQMDLPSALEVCQYLSMSPMEAGSADSPTSGDSARESPITFGPGGRPTRNGYLTKRGKNFGGWKARFFVLDGPVLKYYEAPGGAHLGAIKLQNAQIGKQQHQGDQVLDKDDPDNHYRHAFLILEPKRKDSSSLVRHVLCAESDKERDQWVADLLQYVDYNSEEDDGVVPNRPRKVSGDASHSSGHNSKKKTYGQGRVLNVPETEDELRGVSYESTSPGSIPHGVNAKSTSDAPSPPTPSHERDPNWQASLHPKAISAPKNATLIADTGAWGNKSLAPLAEDRIKQKKRSFFGFGGPKPRGSGELEHANESTSNLTQMSYEQHGPVRAVFGAPLAEAVKYNHPVDVDAELPAVVYRCIEYLDAKDSAAEEGIFRLSGSNVVIKSLRERFNVEGDVNLITDDQYYDIHAVASLLKLYLRELPTTILTRELHLDFLAVTELHDSKEKVAALNVLVHKLPKANGALLRYLSGFLIRIVNNSDVNKMTIRNVGIVFSPTLNIPAPVFALFLQQYDEIFNQEPEHHNQSPVEVTVTAPLTPDDVRSPRRQMFQELPTPSYNQQTFARTPTALSHPGQHNPAAYDTGFTPLQPSYEIQSQGTFTAPEYGSLAQAMASPAYENSGSAGSTAYMQYPSEQPGQGAKSKRRESSMFSMGLGGSKAQPSFNKLKQDHNLVDEEPSFE